MSSFESLLQQVLSYGEERGSRAGATYSLFAPDPIRFDLTGQKAALISSKQVPWKMALREFMWMLSGSTNVNDLRKSSPAMGAIWDNWADTYGNIGPTYGAQYRNAGGLQGTDGYTKGARYGNDQLAQVIDRLEKTPDTRRAVISLWSAPELDAMKLEPCMVLFQFSRRGPNLEYLDLQVYQRSADMMLGVPFDLFQASVLMHLVARELGRRGQAVTGRYLTWMAGDVHLYHNQVEPAHIQLDQWRTMSADQWNGLPALTIDPFPSLSILDGTLEPGHINVVGYNPQPPVDGGKIAV
jgi:thymidylate synthase